MILIRIKKRALYVTFRGNTIEHELTIKKLPTAALNENVNSLLIKRSMNVVIEKNRDIE